MRAGRARAFLHCFLASLLACSGDATGPGGPGAPSAATFVTSDIDRFWSAYDAGGKSGSAPAFQVHYLDSASAGLRDFIGKRSVTAASLVTMVAAYPRYFAAIRANTLALAHDRTTLDRIRAGYEHIESLYPAATFPPVTFLIGRFSTGGTTSNDGMLIGTEFFAIDDNTPLDELGAFQRANVNRATALPLIVAHEHAHILQLNAQRLMSKQGKTLLDQSLLEGGADFVGEVESGGHINVDIHAWAQPREAQVWAEFRNEMNGTDVTRWLYNQGSSTETRPGDLGYFVGYRIARAYYMRAADKRQALREIIEVGDAAAFLAASGYTGN